MQYSFLHLGSSELYYTYIGVTIKMWLALTAQKIIQVESQARVILRHHCTTTFHVFSNSTVFSFHRAYQTAGKLCELMMREPIA